MQSPTRRPWATRAKLVTCRRDNAGPSWVRRACFFWLMRVGGGTRRCPDTDALSSSTSPWHDCAVTQLAILRCTTPRHLRTRVELMFARRFLIRGCQWCRVGRYRVSSGEFRAHLDGLDGSGRACVDGDTEGEYEEAGDEERPRAEHENAYA